MCNKKVNMSCMLGLMIVALVVESNAVDLPSHFTRCHQKSADFMDCLSKAVSEAVVSMADGLKSFKILPLEPLAVDGVSIGDNGGVVSIKQAYKNIKVHGLTKGLKLKYKSVSPDFLTIRSESYNDQVDFVADYVMSGKILLLPISGNGRANISMHGLTSQNSIKFQKYEKNGESYLKMIEYDIKFSPKKVTFDLENLFNGDPVLSTQMNKFLNENADLVFKESQGPFEETFGLLFVNIANKIFSQVPVSQIYPD